MHIVICLMFNVEGERFCKPNFNWRGGEYHRMVVLVYIIFLMNDSLTSAEENYRNPKSLFEQMHTINTDDWKNQDFSFSPYNSFDQSLTKSEEEPSIINELPLQSKICEPMLQLQQALNQNNQMTVDEWPSDFMEQQNQKDFVSSILENSQVLQVTITLHEQTLASKVYEEIQTEDNSSFLHSLISFLSLKDKNYRPHILCMKFLFNRLKEFGQKSLDNLKHHITYLQIKMKQEIESLKSLDEFQIIFQCVQQIQQYREKEKVDRMKESNLHQKTKKQEFYHLIKEIYEQLLSVWGKIKQKRQKRQKYIQEQIIQMIDQIEHEMEDIIKCRLMNEKEKTDYRFLSEKIRSQNAYLTKDKYLEMRYLMQRQNTYLKLISDFNGKIITYMISMISKEELQIGKNIQEALVKYTQGYMSCYDQDNLILKQSTRQVEQTNVQDQLKLQLSELLLTFIPKELYDINQNSYKIKPTSDKLSAILSNFSNFIQNTIFLTTIQMNNDFILFRNEALWKTSKSFLEQQENSIDYVAKQNQESPKRRHHSPNLAEFKLSEDVRIVVVLTSNYYLHLENEDNIATVKLCDVKISKKGREVVITDKKKGIGGFFGIKTELGRLQFQTAQEVDIFAQKLSLAIKRLSYA